MCAPSFSWMLGMLLTVGFSSALPIVSIPSSLHRDL
jgi:hypothetical protein